MAKRRKSPRSKDALQLTRRGFAKRAVAGGVVIWAASRLAWPARLPEGATHENLDRTEAAVLVAAFEVIAGRSDPTEIRGALGRMDAFVGGIEGRPRWELRAALHLVQQSPLLFHGYLSRFSG
ncbi:MAG TPA: hypothetical protein VL588_00660, partial [Bdellovibrionota bacterium]|nr:hypothetical protein [Bdellovibrionota bacterium]